MEGRKEDRKKEMKEERKEDRKEGKKEECWAEERKVLKKNEGTIKERERKEGSVV